jgi:hypothetical protein
MRASTDDRKKTYEIEAVVGDASNVVCLKYGGREGKEAGDLV